jgi:hypothetical protein
MNGLDPFNHERSPEVQACSRSAGDRLHGSIHIEKWSKSLMFTQAPVPRQRVLNRGSGRRFIMLMVQITLLRQHQREPVTNWRKDRGG